MFESKEDVDEQTKQIILLTVTFEYQKWNIYKVEHLNTHFLYGAVLAR
jgi:hypothetical protein